MADNLNPWLELRRLTPARIALGRTGTSLPTQAQLDFQFAHAQARDAVHLPFDHPGLSTQLAERGRASLLLHSAAADHLEVGFAVFNTAGGHQDKFLDAHASNLLKTLPAPIAQVCPSRSATANQILSM